MEDIYRAVKVQVELTTLTMAFKATLLKLKKQREKKPSLVFLATRAFPAAPCQNVRRLKGLLHLHMLQPENEPEKKKGQLFYFVFSLNT